MHVVFIGYGAVARCVTVMWHKILPNGPKATQFTIIEPRDVPFERYIACEGNANSQRATTHPEIPCEHIQLGLTRENYRDVLDSILSIDLIIDLSVHVDSLSIIEYCHARGLNYISTALEDWDDYPSWKGTIDDITQRTLAYKQYQIMDKYPAPSATMLIDHGMNPGLITHFVKRALVELAAANGIKCDRKSGGSSGDSSDSSSDINTTPGWPWGWFLGGGAVTRESAGIPTSANDYVNASCFASIAQQLGLQTIHCSERDTQITNKRITADTFTCTWSPIGFYEEVTDPSQMGWGTSESTLPPDAIRYESELFLPTRGIETFARSYEPFGGELVGNVVPHGESSTIVNYLTIGTSRTNATYRPSMYYVYNSCPAAMQSLANLKVRNYDMMPNFHVLESQEIISGYDSVGALMLFDVRNSFFSGTSIDNKFAKTISPYINATTIQVACGVLSGVDWIVRNPNEGICWPESVPYERVFELSGAFLGDITCKEVPWKPKSNSLVDLLTVGVTGGSRGGSRGG